MCRGVDALDTEEKEEAAPENLRKRTNASERRSNLLVHGLCRDAETTGHGQTRICRRCRLVPLVEKREVAEGDCQRIRDRAARRHLASLEPTSRSPAA